MTTTRLYMPNSAEPNFGAPKSASNQTQIPASRRELPFAFTSFKRQERRPVILPTPLSCIRELRDELSRLLGILASEVIFVELGVATYPESA